MPITSMICPKCGYTQMAAPACKSCGAQISGVLKDPEPKAEVKRHSSPPYKRTEGGPIHRFSFHGNGGSLFGIQIVNIFLTLITLGIYHFWGKVRVRNYLLSQSEFEGDRFAYHGTGKELLIGFLKAVIVFGAISAGFQAIPLLPGGTAVRIVAGLIVYTALLVFIPVAMVGARRYRLSRTSWRGIRFSFRGSAKEFIRIFIQGTLLTVVTLGFYKPFFDAHRYAFMTSQSFFGHQKFGFDGHGRDLFHSYLIALLLTIPTLGLCWFWYAATAHRYLWDHTTFFSGNARFHSVVTGGKLLVLKSTNLLLLILSFGLAWPWITVRSVKFAFMNLTLEGLIDMEMVQQEAKGAAPIGDALESLLNLDSGFDSAS